MVQLTVVHPNQSNETIPETVGYERTREIGKMRRARIEVLRETAQNVTLQPKTDKIELGNKDTLRLVDIENGAETYTLVCYSLEWDANRVAPTPGGDERQGDDQTLITNLVGAVPDWSAGTINSFSGPLSFVFNHAQQHEAIRRIERNVQGEILFRDSGTVDYTDRLGSDKSGSIELSASAGTIEDEIQITKRGRELDGTHVRVLGAHEGEAQLSANLVPASDSASYSNRVNYTSPRWSDGDPRDWDRWENKDITDQATLDEEAATLGEELKSELVEAKATVPDGVNISVGDTVRVIKPDAGLDRDMRIHRLKEIVQGAVRKLDVLLSTRTTLRKDGSDDLRDIQRFNTGFQGSSVVVTGGPVTAAVDASNSLSFGFRYPALEAENNAELRVQGLSYRVDSQPKSHSHDVDIDIPDHDHDVDVNTTTADGGSDAAVNVSQDAIAVNDTFVELDIDFPFVTGDSTYGLVFVHVENESSSSSQLIPEITMINEDTNNTFYNETGGQLLSGGSDIAAGINTGDIEGDTVNVELEQAATSNDPVDMRLSARTLVVAEHEHNINATETSDDGGAFFTTESSSTATGQEAGIFSTNDTPSNVDVLVNGSTVATDIGSGTFQTTVDLSGELTTNAWNTITLTSDSLGRLQASTFLQGYDQIGTQ